MTKTQNPTPDDGPRPSAVASDTGTDDAPEPNDVEGHVTSLREGGHPDARIHVRESDPWASRGGTSRRRPHKS